MIAKYMDSYLKQSHIKKAEKIGVSSYKLLLNSILLGILTNIAYIFKKSPVTFMLKTTSKIEKT
jgi:hypothetical protein